MSVGEALRSMFMRIEDHFLDMAAQMMAAIQNALVKAGSPTALNGLNKLPNKPKNPLDICAAIICAAISKK